jgi:tetratricopeptide (TPR) repeat protein
MGSEHGGELIYRWPEFRGLDISLYKEDLEVIGIYFLDPKYNFFGITDTRALSGLVHYANKHDLPGKKIWSWGRNLSGENRSWHLCLEQQFYGEVQSGRLVIQEHLEWLMPEQSLTWDEQWSPIHGLSNVTEVTEDCAFQLLADEKKILCYPFTNTSDQKLQITLDGRTVRELELPTTASELTTVDISDMSADDISRMNVKVIKSSSPVGSLSTTNRCARRLPSEIRSEPIFDDHSSIAQFITAEFSHKLMYNKKALHYYRSAIVLDDLNYKAHIGLGIMQFEQADFAAAQQSFLKAIDIYKWDTEPYIMLSHIYQLQGDLDDALENAFTARYYGEQCRGNIRVGEVYIALGQYANALKFLDEAKHFNSMSLRVYALAAICERKLGNQDNALAQLDESPEIPLKDLMWYSERWFLGKIDLSELEEALFHDEWRFLELGINYAELGLCDEAEKLLDAGITQRKAGWPMLNLYNPDRLLGFYRSRETPFLHVLKGYIASKAGRKQDADKHFKEGDYFEYYVNANQPELIPALIEAAESGNAHANHYLGDFMYRNLRYEDGLSYWKSADAKAPKHPQTLRNLSVYARFIENKPEEARRLLQEAIELNPNDAFIRRELVETERACGASAQDVLDIYLGAPQVQRDTYLFRELLAAYMTANRWEEAAEYLNCVDRRYCDEDNDWFNFAVSYADHLIDEGKPKEALEWIEKSRPTPRNLGYITYTDEYIPFHKKYYLAGVACKMLGDKAKAEECFRKAVEQPTEFHFFKPIENGLNLCRFYVALAMKELGMDATARTILGGINTYRESQALVLLNLEKAEISRWMEHDPDSVIVAKKHAGPEI